MICLRFDDFSIFYFFRSGLSQKNRPQTVKVCGRLLMELQAALDMLAEPFPFNSPLHYYFIKELYTCQLFKNSIF